LKRQRGQEAKVLLRGFVVFFFFFDVFFSFFFFVATFFASLVHWLFCCFFFSLCFVFIACDSLTFASYWCW
jgi:hypothetical protein